MKRVEGDDYKVKLANEISRRQFMKHMGGAVVSGGLLSGLPLVAGAARKAPAFLRTAVEGVPKVDRIVADPANIPPPIKRDIARTHNIAIESKEVIGEIEDGVQFHYMTFGGQVPAPMIRVRQGGYSDRYAQKLHRKHNNTQCGFPCSIWNRRRVRSHALCTGTV